MSFESTKVPLALNLKSSSYCSKTNHTARFCSFQRKSLVVFSSSNYGIRLCTQFSDALFYFP